MSFHNTCMAGLKFIVQQWLGQENLWNIYIAIDIVVSHCLDFEFEKF